MKPAAWISMTFLIAATPTWAVEKCKDANGKTYYSDRGCTGGGQKVKGDPSGGAHSIGTAAGDQETARRCVDHALGRGAADGGEKVRVESYRVKTVAVKDLGPRRLFTVSASILAPNGIPYDSQQVECLLRGDNVTFQTTPYEIVN